MTAELLGLSASILVVVGALIIGIALLLRSQRLPDTWDLIDVLLVLLVLVWMSTGSGLFTFKFATGAWVPTGDPPVVLMLIATAIGTLSSTAACFWRASGKELGLVWASRRWMWVAVGLVVPFLVFSTGWVWLLEVLGYQVLEQDLLAQLRSGELGPAAVGFLLLYGVVVAPITEEVLFRGFLLPPLITQMGRWPAIFTGGLLFGLLHGSDAPAIMPLAVLGVMLGWLRVASRSLWPALTLHMVNNILAMGIVMLGFET